MSNVNGSAGAGPHTCPCDMQDPVSDSDAVLIKSSNITQQKELELELERRQDFLRRCAAQFMHLFGFPAS